MSFYCYCGRSETLPFCDGSHALPRPRPQPEEDKGNAGDDKPDADVPSSPGSGGDF